MKTDTRSRYHVLIEGFTAFCEGCFAVSWIGTAGAVVICFAIFMALIFGVTAKRFAAHPTRFMANKTDGFPVLKATAIRLTSSKSLHRLRVVIIGDSGLREAISSPAELQAFVSAGTKRSVDVIPLTSGGMTQLDAVDLCGMLCGKMRGEVVLEVSPFWMSKGEEISSIDHTLDRIGFDSEALADELVIAGCKRPVWRDNFFLRNIRFMLSRTDAVFQIFHPFPAPSQHIREIHGDTIEAELKRDLPRIFRLTEHIRRRAPSRLTVYQRMIHRLKVAGIHVTLIEAPLNPRFLTDVSAKVGLPTWVMEDYYRARAALIRRNHVPLWDLNEECHFTGSDFRDAFHIDQTAPRKRFTHALADHIVASLDTIKESKTQ